MERATAKSEATRTRIVDGALRLLQSRGVEAATTRAIAAEAGVRLATLHYHFASKDALLTTVLEVVVGQMTEVLRAEVREHADLPDRAEELLRAAWRLVCRTRALQIVQYEVTIYALRTPGVQWLARQQYESYAETYTDILAGGAQPSPGLRELARTMLAGMDGLILQELAMPDQRRNARTLRHLIEAARVAARELQCQLGHVA